MRLAGTYHPVAYILERMEQFLPGVQEIQAVWKDFEGRIHSEQGVFETIPEASLAAVQVWRQRKAGFEWSSTPGFFSFPRKTNEQLTLDSENRLNVLIIYFDSPVDHLKDILAIHFPENIFLKSLDATFSGLSAKEKLILSNILSSILNAEYSRVLKERELLTDIEKIQHNQLNKVQVLKSHLKQSEELYTSALARLMDDITVSYEDELSKPIHFNKEVVTKLAKERLPLAEIEAVLKRAIYAKFNLNPSKKHIELVSDDLIVNAPDIREFADTRNARNSKHHDLLDRYEQAAENLKIKGKKINGKNLAAFLNPPVTPPAITDAVKKNEKKISFLFKEFPDRWPLVRRGIRPLQMIDEGVSDNLATGT
ncbi:MAG: hypothetical protein R3277_06135 [Brumimicrobium sp.]|nr:hypothetical protein [Brumimicrobium sp.]